MSTNYNILLLSEKKLKDLVLQFVSLVHEMHSKLWRDANKYIDSGDKGIIFDNCEKRVKKSQAMEDELLDECIWTISKDDPRANHLRFIISVIYSTKDIARACEYTSSIAKKMVRFDISKKMVEDMTIGANMYLAHIEKMIELYKGGSEDKIEKYEEIYTKFEVDFEKQQNKVLTKYNSNELIQSQILRIYRLSLSTIERLQSIFSSVIFSKSSNNTKTIEIKKSKNK